MKVNSSFIKTLFNKISKFDKKTGIHHNGTDNNYSELVESLIANSVTALRCQKLMASYLAGKGFGEDSNKIVVHKGKGISLLKFTQDIADSFSEQNGVFIHVNYNGAYEIKDMQVLPYTDCRVGRKDSNRYAGKIVVCDDWSDNKAIKNARSVHVYNPDKTVITSQVKNAGTIDKYNGQILFVHFGKYTYPLAHIHPCIEDADSEKQTSIYKNTSLRKGFFGKMLVVTRPMVDDLNGKDSKEYKEQVSARENFRETIQEFVGAENSDGVMHFEMEFETDKLEDSIMFKQIDSNINDKLFAHTENSVADNIRMCFNNVPAALIRSQDGKMFGSSGESVKAMKEFYQDQTTNERMILAQTVNRLMKHHVNKREDLQIVPLITIKQEA